VRTGVVTWQQLEGRGLLLPARQGGRRWMAGFNLRDRK
jgi:hypothetical protein